MSGKVFYWLEKTFIKNISEFEASKKLESFGMENPGFFSLSFPTISATGSNASIIRTIQNLKVRFLKILNYIYVIQGGNTMEVLLMYLEQFILGKKTYSKK